MESNDIKSTIHTIFLSGLFHSAYYFTQHKYCTHPFCFMHQFIPSYCWEILDLYFYFHCINIPQCFYPLKIDKHLVCLQVLIILSNNDINIHVQVFVWIYAFFFSWVNIQIVGPWVIWQLYVKIFNKLQNFFPKWFYSFAFWPSAYGFPVSHIPNTWHSQYFLF